MSHSRESNPVSDEQLNLSVKVNADTGKLEVLGASFDKTAGQAKKAEQSFSGLTGEAGNLLKSFLPFATAGGIIAFFSSAVSAAEAQNESMRRLKFTVESSGQSWEKNRDSIVKWSEAIQSSTRFSDDQALKSLEKLTLATGNVAQAQKASKLAMDLSVSSGKPLAETTELVNGLIVGQARAVMVATKEFGTFVDGATTGQGVLDALGKHVQGASEKEEGLTKSAQQTTHAFEDFQKKIGQTFVPGLQMLAIGATKLITVFENIGTAVATAAAVIFHNVEGTIRVIIAAMKGNFREALTIAKETMGSIVSDVKEGAAEITNSWAESEQTKTTATLQGTSNRLIINAAAAAKQKDEQDKALREEMQAQQERANKVYELEAQLEQKVAGLNRSTLQSKIAALNAEVNAESVKIQKVARAKVEAEKLQDKLNQYHKEKADQLAKEEMAIKQQLAFDIASTAVQTLQAVNSLGEKGSEQERIRAKALLAIQQSIAIGWIWVNATKAGPLGVALATAQTALVVAQFAQGLKNIDRAGAQEKSGIEGIKIDAPVPGIDTGAGGGGGSFIPGGSVGGGGGSGSVAGSSGAGGQNLQFVITFNGDVIVNGVEGAEELSPRMADKLGEMIIEKIKGQGQISFTGVV